MVLPRAVWIVAISIALLLVALPVSWRVWPARSPTSVSIDQASLRSLSQLQDQHGNPAANSLQGPAWPLVFFGFTHCADICPATLSRVAQVLEHLGDDAGQLQPVFITLDPQRDTPEHLAAYLGFFDERILGLSGTVEQVGQVADAWGVYSRRVPTDGGYMLDHSTTVFLLSPDGQLRQRFSGRVDDVRMAREIAAEQARLN